MRDLENWCIVLLTDQINRPIQDSLEQLLQGQSFTEDPRIQTNHLSLACATRGCSLTSGPQQKSQRELKNRITPHVTNFSRFRLDIEKQEWKRKYKSDGGTMVVCR